MSGLANKSKPNAGSFPQGRGVGLPIAESCRAAALSRGYARMLKTLLTDDGGIFSSRAMVRTPNPLFFKSPTALEYAFNVAGRPSLTPRFMAAAGPR